MAIKARSNHRAMIEDQFVILSQMTEEIKYNFDKRIDKIEQIAKEDAISQSDGDDIIFHSVLNNNSYQTEIQKSYDMIIQARQIVFCAIYSYYETMLNRIIIQYSLPAQKNEKKDAKSIIQFINKDLSSKTNDNFDINDTFINDYCRLLRNHFMHGILSDIKKQQELTELSEYYGSVEYHISDAYIIYNSFITKVLKSIHNIIIYIDNAYSAISSL